MALAFTSPQLVMKAQSAVSGVWGSLQGLFGFNKYSDFSPEEMLAKTPNIDPRFIAQAPMSNANLDVHTLSELGKIGLKRSKEITAQSHPELYQAFAEMSARAGLKQPPQLILSESKTVNALTVSPQEMVVTTGLLKLLNLREVSAVLGHELGHGTSNHTSPRVIASGIFVGGGALTGEYLSRLPVPAGSVAAHERSFFQRLTGLGRGRHVMPGYLPETVFNMFIGGWLGSIVANQISVRPTELDADRKGAHISGDPEGLISALQKLEGSRKAGPIASFIAHLQSGYPSTETRIRRLRTVAQSIPEAPAAPVVEVAPVAVAAIGNSPTALITGAALAERVHAPDAPALANG